MSREDDGFTPEQLEELDSWIGMLQTEVHTHNWWYALSWALDIATVLQQRLNPYEEPKIDVES